MRRTSCHNSSSVPSSHKRPQKRLPPFGQSIHWTNACHLVPDSSRGWSVKPTKSAGRGRYPVFVQQVSKLSGNILDSFGQMNRARARTWYSVVGYTLRRRQHARLVKVYCASLSWRRLVPSCLNYGLGLAVPKGSVVMTFPLPYLERCLSLTRSHSLFILGLSHPRSLLSFSRSMTMLVRVSRCRVMFLR